MSPELERLLQALYEKRTCPPEEKPQRDATSSGYCRRRLRTAEKPAGTSYSTLCMIGTRSFAGLDASRLPCHRGRKCLQAPNIGETDP